MAKTTADGVKVFFGRPKRELGEINRKLGEQSRDPSSSNQRNQIVSSFKMGIKCEDARGAKRLTQRTEVLSE